MPSVTVFCLISGPRWYCQLPININLWNYKPKSLFSPLQCCFFLQLYGHRHKNTYLIRLNKWQREIFCWEYRLRMTSLSCFGALKGSCSLIHWFNLLFSIYLVYIGEYIYIHDGHGGVASLAKCVPSMYKTMNLIHRIHIKKEKAMYGVIYL